MFVNSSFYSFYGDCESFVNHKKSKLDKTEKTITL